MPPGDVGERHFATQTRENVLFDIQQPRRTHAAATGDFAGLPICAHGERRQILDVCCCSRPELVGSEVLACANRV